MAYMMNAETDEPFIVVCDILFKHKSIPQTTCRELGNHVSYKMMTLGGSLLHEIHVRYSKDSEICLLTLVRH